MFTLILCWSAGLSKILFVNCIEFLNQSKHWLIVIELLETIFHGQIDFFHQKYYNCVAFCTKMRISAFVYTEDDWCFLHIRWIWLVLFTQKMNLIGGRVFFTGTLFLIGVFSCNMNRCFLWERCNWMVLFT